MGGLSPVSISISTNSVLSMLSFPLEIMSSNQSHRSWNLPFVSSVMFVYSRLTFLWVSTSAGDLKFDAIIQTLCYLVSMYTWANSMYVLDVCCGTQFRGVVSSCSILNISLLVSSFSANAMRRFLGRYKFSVVLRFTVIYCVIVSLHLLDRSAYKLYMYMLGLLVKQSSSGSICTLSILWC